jgi:thermitase
LGSNPVTYGTRMRTISQPKNNAHFNTIARPLGFLTVALAAAWACAPAIAQVAPPKNGNFAAGRLLVMPQAGLPEAALANILKENGANGARRVGQTDLHIVDLPPGNETAVLARLAHNPHFKFAELDESVEPSFMPNDPYLGSSWHIAKIGAPQAWDFAQGTGVTIAILDTGVSGTHPDLYAQMVPGWNFYDNSSNTNDVKGHGTWVAGAAAATINNGTGVAAIAGKARIMPIRISDGAGTAYWSHIAQGITYAADRGARVANVSYENLLKSSSIISAANYMKSKGGLVVVAAGNCSCNPGLTPTTSMISVSATDANDQRASFSSYGSYVGMSAPGVSVYTTAPGGGYTQGLGTSFASPVVAATVALMMSAKPTMSNTQIESLLFSTATDLGAAGRDVYFGYGRVNAAAAVQAAVGTTATVDSQAPTASISNPLASATVSGLVSVNVSANDNVGVAKVVLRVNGTAVATDTTAPYGFSWDSKTVANGMSNLTAVAYDAAGNAGTSTQVAVNVANTTTSSGTITTADTIKPVVTLLSPTNGTSIKGLTSVTIKSSASDNVLTGLKQSLYIDGQLKATAAGGSLSYTWNLSGVANGKHYIKVIAYDAVSNSSSAIAKVTR